MTLSDVTPNRGTVEYYGDSELAAGDVCPADGRVFPVHADNVEAPEIGDRAYHDGEFAWRSLGYSDADTEDDARGDHMRDQAKDG